MPKVNEPLTDKKIKAEIKKGANKISDGAISGLALHKTKSGYVWRLRYTYGKKRSYYAIGEYPVVSLKEAREIAREAKLLLEKGIDPNIYKTATGRINKRTKQKAYNRFDRRVFSY